MISGQKKTFIRIYVWLRSINLFKRYNSHVPVVVEKLDLVIIKPCITTVLVVLELG